MPQGIPAADSIGNLVKFVEFVAVSGLLLFETPNPLSNRFYADPSCLRGKLCGILL